MAVNPYFNKFHQRSEQNLVDDLIIESIQIHGILMQYLPRGHEKLDLIYGEDVLSKFDDYYDLEFYLKTVDGFTGDGDLMSKFGIDIRDQATLWVSRTRFNSVVADEMIRPKEGDLLYYPFNGALFEVKFVTNESIHYQLGDFYVYELTIQQFAYSDEKLDTGITEIDQVEEDHAQTLLFNIGTGSGNYNDYEQVYQGTSLATATAKGELVESNNPTGTLKVRNISGQFSSGVNIVGDTSNASYILTSYNPLNDLNDPLDDSTRLENEADLTLDFSEKDPFSDNDY